MAQEGQVDGQDEEDEGLSDGNSFISRGPSLHDLRQFKSTSTMVEDNQCHR